MFRHPSSFRFVSTSYRPDIDGLRALAVSVVILFHAGVDLFPGGFVGVDVFFVISGFLITGLLLEDLRTGRFDLADFYARRARRILPALAVVMLCTSACAMFVLDPAQLEDHFRLLWSVALFHSNFVLATSTGYFDGPAELRPLLHTWSLGVEEQFYFLFPLALALVWHRRRTAFPLVFGVVALCSLGLAEWGWRHHHSANFFFTPSRVWELLLGSLCAWSVRPGARIPVVSADMREFLVTGGLLAVVTASAVLGHHTPSPSAWMLLPTVGTALVLVFGTVPTHGTRLLTLKPVRTIGLISYSAYLWHQPILAFVKLRSLGTPEPVTVGGAIVLTFCLAFVTWRFVEQPFRRSTFANTADTLAFAARVTVGLVLVGVLGQFSNPVAVSKVPDSVRQAFSPPVRQEECFDIPRAHEKPDAWHCRINPAIGSPTFVLFGDSHALQMLEAFETAAVAAGRSGVFAGFSGCAPLLDIYPLNRPDQETHNCPALNQRMLALARDLRVREVYLVAKWSYYTDTGYGSGHLNAIGLAPKEPINRDNSRAAFQEGVRRTVQAYAKAGIRLILIEQVPQQEHPPATMYQRAWTDPDAAEQTLRKLSVPLDKHRALQAFPAQIFREISNAYPVEIVNLDDEFCDESVCPVGTAEQSRYQDASHLSAEGALRLVPRLTRLLGPTHGRD